MLTTQAVFALATAATGLNLSNYLQEDYGAWLIDAFRWITGSGDVSYFTEKETPIPYGLGPIWGRAASLALTAAGETDYEIEEWLWQYGMPRGPRKQIEAGVALVEGLKTRNGWNTLGTLARVVGLNPKFYED